MKGHTCNEDPIQPVCVKQNVNIEDLDTYQIKEKCFLL